MNHSSLGARDGRRNVRLLAFFAPALIVTGTAGLMAPGASPISTAPSHDWFHIVCGTIGLGVVSAGSRRGAALFNLAFGAIDLWQAAAGVLGVFPAAWFALRPADHVVHVSVGVLLVAVGGTQVRARQSSFQELRRRELEVEASRLEP